MKILKNRVISLFMAIVMITSLGTLSITAQEGVDTVRVGDYDCVERDGVFVAEINGEEYIILSTSSDSAVTDPELIAFLERETMKRSEFDLSQGQVYDGYAYMGLGSASSAMFNLKPRANTLSILALKTWFLFNTKVTMTFYYYIPVTGEWKNAHLTLNLNSIPKQFAADTASREVTKAYFIFWKDGSDVLDFNYQVYQ